MKRFFWQGCEDSDRWLQGDYELINHKYQGRPTLAPFKLEFILWENERAILGISADFI